MALPKSPRVGILSIGTELSDGQVQNCNSAWLSEKCLDLDLQVVEHRVVPDAYELILKSLGEMRSRCDLLITTGGLGPTSDDFTREVVAEFASAPLAFSEPNWIRVQDILNSRGVVTTPLQKQQCRYPAGSKIYENPVGTADAFSLKTGSQMILVLPGPPREISALWESCLESEIRQTFPSQRVEQLKILRCLGKGEGEVAERVEKVLENSGLRIGYRATRPYVEVKVWYDQTNAMHLALLRSLKDNLKEWIVNFDYEDLATELVQKLANGNPPVLLTLEDYATWGQLTKRLMEGARRSKLELHLNSILTSNPHVYSGPDPIGLAKGWIAKPGMSEPHQFSAQDWYVHLAIAPASTDWILSISRHGKKLGQQKISPPYRYKVDSEAAQLYITERILAIWRDWI